MQIEKALIIDHLHGYGVKVRPGPRHMGPQDPWTLRPGIPLKVLKWDLRTPFKI